MSCWISVRDDPRVSLITPGPTDQRRTGSVQSWTPLGAPSLLDRDRKFRERRGRSLPDESPCPRSMNYTAGLGTSGGAVGQTNVQEHRIHMASHGRYLAAAGQLGASQLPRPTRVPRSIPCTRCLAGGTQGYLVSFDPLSIGMSTVRRSPTTLNAKVPRTHCTSPFCRSISWRIASTAASFAFLSFSMSLANRGN
jgi:hypothetical protein